MYVRWWGVNSAGQSDSGIQQWVEPYASELLLPQIQLHKAASIHSDGQLYIIIIYFFLSLAC